MPKLSEQSKKLLKERAGEVAQRTKENTAYRKDEARNPGKYSMDADAMTPIRKTEAGKYGDSSDMLRGAGMIRDMKIHKALKESGAE